MSTRAIVPRNDNEGSIGTTLLKWAYGYFYNLVCITINGLALAGETIGFTISGGGTSKTLTVPLDATVSGINTGDQAIREIYKTCSADGPLTATECRQTIVSNFGMTDADCVIDLPTAAEGLSFDCILPAVRAKYFRLRCPSAQADKINLLAAGVWVPGLDDGYVGVASGYSANAMISMLCAKVADGGFEWFAKPVAGTWVAG